MSRQPILIVGASGRAAAASALRAGFDPFVLDLFADADTERLCPVFKLPMDEYPHGFVELAKRAPPMPWMYTGGLENYPDVVGAISESRELWGNGPEVLRKVRDPFRLSELISRQSSPVRIPRTVESGDQRIEPKRWLRKPLRGSGGSGIRFANAIDGSKVEPTSFLQEFVAGDSVSMTLVHGRLRSGDVLGLSRQLIGVSWLHARPFQYCGNIGLHFPKTINWGSVAALAVDIPNTSQIGGIWGVDFIVSEGEVYLIEINPRYTASTEIFELRKGVGFLRHLVTIAVPRQETKVRQKGVIGKAIYYAPHCIVFPASGPWDDSLAHCTDVWRLPDFADIPHAGDTIEAGHPVLTIFAEAPDDKECEAKLKAHAAELDSLFTVR